MLGAAVGAGGMIALRSVGFVHIAFTKAAAHDRHDWIDTDVTEPTSKDCPVIILKEAPHQGPGKKPSLLSSRTLYRCDKLTALPTLWQ